MLKISLPKALLYTTLAVAFPLTVSGDEPRVPYTPVEDRAIIDVAPRAAQILAEVVRQSGYTCSSISAAHPFLLSDGHTLKCNSYRYVYEIEDKGGRLVVKVK
jgi:hypothetical protein